MSGTLYVIGTPIGNLEDMTLRQLRILQEVDFIAAEDTRVTRKLLSHYDVHTPMVSYHDHSGQLVTQQLLQRIAAGETCGIVTDAGMPCISDPGEILVRLCKEQGIPVTAVPGPSAAITALAISGQETGRFTFEGFLSVTKKQRQAHLQELKTERRTMIFYEAPHKLVRTLTDFADYFGKTRSLSICRELTKLHEEVWKTTIAEALQRYETQPPKGEFVLIVAGAPEQTETDTVTMETALQQVQERLKTGERLTDACKAVAAETGYRKQTLYQAYQNQTEKTK
ncbi:MAG: 16S rRNA (cytidine(1402)-2'-O)-methyltransferase [Oscillospiraceae bacterium]|nr:16S rRNA (cytidine(1402)-2'-O)-methyltransferase [Oscillospiraceae bacterium]